MNADCTADRQRAMAARFKVKAHYLRGRDAGHFGRRLGARSDVIYRKAQTSGSTHGAGNGGALGHVAGLGYRRHRTRLYRAVVPGGELRGPPAHSAWKFGASLHLSVLACDLLHVLDVLRLGRTS